MEATNSTEEISADVRAVKPRKALCRRRGIVLGVALLGAATALSGCRDHAAGAPVRPTPSAATREIRKVDFSNLEWFDWATSSTVKLVDGLGRRDADNESGGFTWKMLGPPRYADVDGDGHEDAAVGLYAAGGQLDARAWYIWLWHNDRAEQLRVPIVTTSRCSKPIESVTALPHGFMVRDFVAVREDTCAGGGSVPVTYVVAVRHGWPVRIAPYYGPIASCDPRSLTVALHPPGKVLLYTSPDVRSPSVEPAAGVDEFFVDEYSADPRLTPDRDWILGIAVTGARRVCGWARADRVRSSPE